MQVKDTVDSMEIIARSLNRRLRKLCSLGARHDTRQLWRSLSYLASQINPEIRMELQPVITKVDGKHDHRYNLIASIGGDPGSRVVTIGGHYDTVSGTVGADDNASGAVSVVELANILNARGAGKSVKAGYRLEFVLFTNEEWPHFGTTAMGSSEYFSGDRDIAQFINFDCIGYPIGSDGKVYLLYHTEDQVTGTLFSGAPANFIRWHDRSNQFGRLSDQRWVFGSVPTVHLNDMAITGNPNMHRRSDVPDTLSYRYMAGVVLGVADILERKYLE